MENCLMKIITNRGKSLAKKTAGIYYIGYNSIHSKFQDPSLADFVIDGTIRIPLKL
jgi:hypothetical protein